MAKFEKELKIDQDQNNDEFKENKDSQDETSTSKDEIQNLENNWKIKVWNFLAYWVDGGILISKFTIIRIIEAIMSDTGDK